MVFSIRALSSLNSLYKIFIFILISSCASLEEKLCNTSKAFQMGYDDVVNGKTGRPGLQEGEACKKSEKYAYADFHRDYSAGFKKAKAIHCTAESATKIGHSDAVAQKAFKESLPKLALCIEDTSVKINLENIYEIAYRKEFCLSSRAEIAGSKDAESFGPLRKTEEDFSLCAYQKNTLYKIYKNSYQQAIAAQCTPARAATLASNLARARKNMSEGLILLEKCPVKVSANLTNVYSSAYQSERSNMMEEERIRMEQERLSREEANRQELLRLKRRQVELEEQRLNQASSKPY